MTPDEFDNLVQSAYAHIPRQFRSRLQNVAMVVEAEPSPAQLAEAGVGPGATLLGLYQGRPLTRRSVFESFAMPDRITIFQGPHERLAGSDDLREGVVVHKEEGGVHTASSFFKVSNVSEGMPERRIESTFDVQNRLAVQGRRGPCGHEALQSSRGRVLRTGLA